MMTPNQHSMRKGSLFLAPQEHPCYIGDMVGDRHLQRGAQRIMLTAPRALGTVCV
jgi:hypothetical protein